MVGRICLDKYTEAGEPTPITFQVWRVQNGSMFPGSNVRDHCFESNLTLRDAVRMVHRRMLAYLDDDRYSASPSFWRENYQAARSKWESWWRAGKTGFRYDAHTICITTSNGDYVHL